MKSYGMDQKLVRLIKAIYSEAQLAVLVNGHLSEWFHMTVGTDPNYLMIDIMRNILIK